MSIRLKIVLIVVPLIVATLLLTGISSYFAATAGISRIAKDFLGFKAQELQKQAESQWGLLVSNKLTDRPEMVAATQAAVEGYARTIILSATELILAVGEDGAVKMGTEELPAGFYQDGEQAALAALAKARSTDLLTITLGGRERVAKGFWFAPFGWYIVVTEERAAFYGQVNQITFRTLIILGVSIGAGILLVLLLANYLTRPLTRVAGTMKEIISTSDLSKRVVVEYRDEIGQLAHTFNLMVGELEKAYRQIKGFAFKAANNKKREEKIRDLFQRYVPEDIIDSIFANTESLLVGKNEHVAVLFSDIRSFTTISEQMGRPDQLVESPEPLLHRHGGRDHGAQRDHRQVHRGCHQGVLRGAGETRGRCAERGSLGYRDGGGAERFQRRPGGPEEARVPDRHRHQLRRGDGGQHRHREEDGFHRDRGHGEYSPPGWKGSPRSITSS